MNWLKVDPIRGDIHPGEGDIASFLAFLGAGFETGRASAKGMVHDIRKNRRLLLQSLSRYAGRSTTAG